MRPAPSLRRVLIVLPSWVGDAAMATPALRLIRDALPGSFIGALCRPGLDDLLAGAAFVDEFHTQAKSGVMTPKHAAAKVRGRAYETALLLTNSFSTALVTRLAFIPRRMGYDRDGRGILLTDKIAPLRNPLHTADAKPRSGFALVPAVNHYWHAAQHLLTAHTGEAPTPLDTGPLTRADRAPMILPPSARLELALTDRDREDAERTLASAGVSPDEPIAILNPGGNNPAKRWPAYRFAQVGAHLARTHRLRLVVNGSPAERDLCAEITAAINDTINASLPHGPPAVCLPDHASTLRGLKAICARAALMVTNDTGPRHIAAAFGIPVVSLFGPTDPRWTTIPHDREHLLLADPDLPPDQSANDHPERCRVDRIETARVLDACEALLSA